MLYRNIRTGRVIDVPSELSGAWEPVSVPAPSAPDDRKEPEPEAPKKTAGKSRKKK